MSAGDQAAYIAFLQSTGLNKFAGGVAPMNAFYQPCGNRFDLHFVQTVPIYKPVELFFDFGKFGTFLDKHLFNYFKKAPLSSNDVFWRVNAGRRVLRPEWPHPAGF